MGGLIDDLEVLKRIKSSESTKSIPVVVLKEVADNAAFGIRYIRTKRETDKPK